MAQVVGIGSEVLSSCTGFLMSVVVGSLCCKSQKNARIQQSPSRFIFSLILVAHAIKV